MVRDAAVAHHVVLGGLVVLLVIPLVVFVDVFELRLLAADEALGVGMTVGE